MRQAKEVGHPAAGLIELTADIALTIGPAE